MCDIIPSGKDWVDVLGALFVPVIGLVGIYIAWRQHTVDKNRLKFELFDKRYSVFEKIGAFISKILITGKGKEGAEVEFLQDTRSVRFLFDEHVEGFVSEIYDKAIQLTALQDGSLGRENLNKQKEIKDWYGKQLKSMQDRFVKHLRVRH